MQTKKILSIATVIMGLSSAPSYAHSNNCFLDKNGAPNPVLSQRQRLSLRNSTTNKNKYFSDYAWRTQIYSQIMATYDLLIAKEIKKKGRPLSFQEAEQILFKTESVGKKLEREWIRQMKHLRANDGN